MVAGSIPGRWLFSGGFFSGRKAFPHQQNNVSDLSIMFGDAKGVQGTITYQLMHIIMSGCMKNDDNNEGINNLKRPCTRARLLTWIISSYISSYFNLLSDVNVTLKYLNTLIKNGGP